MVQFKFAYDANVTVEQRVGFELAAAIWAHYLKDDITVNLRVGGRDNLNGGTATGGAVPILHRQNYGVLNEYYRQDAIASSDGESPSADEQAIASLQTGNTVDVRVNGEVLNGNTEVVLTSAQAKALGMTEGIDLDNGTHWDRDLVTSDALDGYVVINNDFDWNYDFTRSGEAAEGTLDFLSMAMHEIGHNLGFISGLDGTIDVETMLSGQTQISDFTMLDLFRHTVDTADIENPDGSVSSLTIGENSYFSIDGGQTNLADFSTGQEGDGFQASHWKRFRQAIGIMDPTLAYQERASLSELDLQALDVLGWDVDYSQRGGIDLQTLLIQAESAVASSLGVEHSFLSNNRGANNIYNLGYSEWFSLFEGQISEIGVGAWWQIVEFGYGIWQDSDDSDGSSWWDDFEAQMTETNGATWMQELEEELGYSDGGLWDAFEAQLAATGGATWMQMLEVGYSKWWQNLETYFSTLGEAGEVVENGEENLGQVVIDQGASEQSVIVSGGDADDILAGSDFRDLVSGGNGDDLIDGKGGNDSLLGEAGDDILYGFGGDDELYGGDGNDLLAGEDDNDKLYGEAGHDILSGGFGNDLIDGAADNDILKGDGGSDVLDGGTGNDEVGGGDGHDIAIGGDGKDIVSGGRGNDVLYGDRFQGSDGEQSLTLEEIAEQSGFATTAQSVPIDFWVRLEAEDLQLRHFNKDNSAIASGGSLISTGGRGEAKGKFSGPTGIYDIVVGYYDEKDGKGELEVEIRHGRDKQKFEWLLDEDLHDNYFSTKNFTTYTIRGVQLESGEEIKIKGKSEKDELIGIDYLDIISTTVSTPYADAHFYNGSFYLESQTKSSAEASALGGQLIKAQKESAEEYWLKNTIGKSDNIIKVDVSDSQFNLVQDAATHQAANNAVRIEAESFNLSGGYEAVSSYEFASGGAVIEKGGKGHGKATTLFTGESGLYDIFVSYIDEKKDKEASASFGVSGQTLDTWSFDAPEATAAYREVGTRVSLTTGDYFEIKGWADGDEEALIDYVELVAVNDRAENNALEPDVFQIEQLQLEAEDFTWSGEASRKGKDYASGEQLVEAKKDAYAQTTFTGESGLYNISVGYDDEGKGESQLAVWLDGWNNYLGSWNLAEGEKNEIRSQTLLTEIFIKNGETLTFQTGEKKLKIDYIDFSPSSEVDVLGSTGDSGTPTSSDILIEAESIWFNGDGSIDSGTNSNPSGGQFASIINASGSTLFSGETGYYDVVVSYFDNGDATTRLQLDINGLQQDQWQPIQVGGTDAFVERTVASNVFLTDGSDSLQISANRLFGEGVAYVDYIKLIKVDPVGEDTSVTDDSANSDVLRGGTGSDLIYGGEGNDLIYGEDEFDSGLSQVGDNNDTLFGSDGNDTLYGNSGNDTLYGDDDSESVAVEVAPTTANGVMYNGSEYVLTNSRVSWATAQAQAEALGGNLVTINDADEEAWLRSQFGGDQSFWLGINDRASEGNFEWVSGEAVDYTHWAGNGPDNYYNQDYGVIEWSGAEGSQWQDQYSNGGFEDRYGSWQWQYGYRGIIEIKRPETFVNNGGNDKLEGGRGNDTLYGGGGADILDGSDAIAKGAFEIDILGGGLGRDRFVLGSTEQSYYVSDGDNDYALIKDFDASSDVLQLHGSAGSYSHQQDGNNLRLLQGAELVAILENTSELNFNSQSIDFV